MPKINLNKRGKMLPIAQWAVLIIAIGALLDARLRGLSIYTYFARGFLARSASAHQNMGEGECLYYYIQY
jgi:hypothetical protein